MCAIESINTRRVVEVEPSCDLARSLMSTRLLCVEVEPSCDLARFPMSTRLLCVEVEASCDLARSLMSTRLLCVEVEPSCDLARSLMSTRLLCRQLSEIEPTREYCSSNIVLDSRLVRFTQVTTVCCFDHTLPEHSARLATLHRASLRPLLAAPNPRTPADLFACVVDRPPLSITPGYP